jgi:hypothetical protein
MTDPKSCPPGKIRITLIEAQRRARLVLEQRRKRERPPPPETAVIPGKRPR